MRAVVSPFKGVKAEEFMKIHKGMIDQVQVVNLASFITTSNQNLLNNYQSNPILTAYSSKYNFGFKERNSDTYRSKNEQAKFVASGSNEEQKFEDPSFMKPINQKKANGACSIMEPL